MRGLLQLDDRRLVPSIRYRARARRFTFALLLDPEDEDGFLRQWEPDQSGAMTHYGYAFQWFAMALAVIGIAFWQYRKRWTAE